MNVVLQGVDWVATAARPRLQTVKEQELLRRLSAVEQILLKVSKACEEISDAIDEYVTGTGPS